jgi:hypothetical protein
VRLQVSTGTPEAAVGDVVTIRLVAFGPSGSQVTMPERAAFGKLAITPGALSPPVPIGPDRVEFRRDYQLDVEFPEDVIIPELSVAFELPATTTSPAAGPSTGPTTTLTTNPLTIKVRSALNEQDAIDNPRALVEQVSLPEQRDWRRILLWSAAAVILIVSGSIAAFVLMRRAQRPPREPTPEELAETALQALSADWIAQGRARELYYAVTSIVRTYIERKFAIRAPEMTTEEFLRTLTSGGARLPYSAEALHAFLTAADLVKYAGFEPRVEDGRQMLDLAVQFVRRGRQETAMIQPAKANATSAEAHAP